MLRKTAFFLLVAAAALLVAGCAPAGPAVTPVPATKTPKPTFTATANWTPTQEVFPTFTPVPPTAAPETAAPETATEPEATDAAAAPAEEPNATPNPEVRLTANQTVNVRSGPGTAYAIIGRLSAGDSYPVAATNSAGDWLQFELDGRDGWVTAGLVSVNGDMAAIEVAQNIAPPPTAQPRPTARPQPQPQPQPAQPQPTAAPPPAPAAPRYEFNIALVQACKPQAAGNWFEGTVYKGGQPFNGARVVFSYAPDGPWATPPQTSGPHEGYSNWNAGYYSHIVHAAGPQAGTWFVWIVGPNDQRISEVARWQSTGPGEGCNEAVVDFDSR